MNDKDFGSKLKEIRAASGKTVPEISSYLISLGYKASEKTIYSWEAGRSQPTPDAFLDLCRFYNVKDIMSSFGYKSSTFTSRVDMLSPTEQAHIKKYRDLDDPGKEAVESVLEVERTRSIELRESRDRQQKLEEENTRLRSKKQLPNRDDIPEEEWRKYLSTPVAARNGGLLTVTESMAKDIALITRAIEAEEKEEEGEEN